MKKGLLTIVTILFFIFNISAQSRGFNNIVLLQENNVLTNRCPDIASLSKYIKEVQQEIGKYSSIYGDIGNGFVILAIRPFYNSNVWFDLENIGNTNLNELKEKIVSIKPCDVKGGVVLLALTNIENINSKFPMPTEWKQFIDNKSIGNIEIAALIDEIWPPYITLEMKSELLRLIELFRDDKNFIEMNLEKYSFITTYAARSDLTKISISKEWWPEEVSNNKYGVMFLLAYISGNLEKQLIDEDYKNFPQEGLELQLVKYKQLKEIDNNISIKYFEDRLR